MHDAYKGKKQHPGTSHLTFINKLDLFTNLIKSYFQSNIYSCNFPNGIDSTRSAHSLFTRLDWCRAALDTYTHAYKSGTLYTRATLRSVGATLMNHFSSIASLFIPTFETNFVRKHVTIAVNEEFHFHNCGIEIFKHKTILSLFCTVMCWPVTVPLLPEVLDYR